MKSGWFYALVFSSLWITIKMIAFAVQWNLDDIQYFVLLNMALLTASIALFMYRQKRLQTESNVLSDTKIGLKVGLPYTLIISFFLFFYYRDIYPEFNVNKRAAIEQNMDTPEKIAKIRKANNALENKTDKEIIELARKNNELMFSPNFTLSISLLALLVYSTLNSLLIAVIYRKVVFRD